MDRTAFKATAKFTHQIVLIGIGSILGVLASILLFQVISSRSVKLFQRYTWNQQTGMVTDLEYVHIDNEFWGNDQMAVCPAIQFVASDHQIVSAGPSWNQCVIASIGNYEQRLLIGEQVEIYYDPVAPERFQLKDSSFSLDFERANAVCGI